VVDVRRRDFITLLGGALTSWPIPANAQPAARMRTVGVLMGLAADAEAQGRSMAFEQGLEREGWSLGQNLRTSTAMPKAILRACRLLRRSW
jgi:putative tryptophan/tyrosine transport system substrate-binding protein